MPSVTFEITGSWYSGKVFYALKESAFEPSSPIRHVTELCSCFHSLGDVNPVLLDGGPDHRLTYFLCKSL